MISLGLVFFGFGTKDSPLLRTSISAVVSILLLRFWCGRYCWHFSCLFVRMSVWSMALICMSLVVCWLFLKWYVDSREVLCFTSTFI